jgi:Spy/CpxP family protein refolding chaperone
MRKRFLEAIFAGACLAGVVVLGSFAHAQSPGGPPHSGPPPGAPGPGSPGTGPGPGSGGPNIPGPNGSRSPASGAKGPGSAAHSGMQLGPVGRWWDDKSVVRTIGLSREQQQKMDVIFNANKPAILQSYKSFLSEQSKYEKISKQAQVDQTALFTAIDNVSKARAALQKATAQMQLQIRQQMDPDQIAKLEKLP